MINMTRVMIVIIICTMIGFGSKYFVKYKTEQKSIAITNICQDEDLIAKLIGNNVNPFSKMKFLKKRNADCKALLIINKEKAISSQEINYCSILDNSTDSVIMLITAYVHDMYDRETASKELKAIVPLMLPYDYCPQYYDNMINLVKFKKRLGL